MRDFVIKRLRRAPIIEPLWDEYERMLAARNAALAERDAALIERDEMRAIVTRRRRPQHLLYAVPREVNNLAECDFNHTMDIPGYGTVVGDWDLRQDPGRYLGNTCFAGKRVLEVGPASGFLSFYMESKGASVVSIDVDRAVDIVPYTGVNEQELKREFVHSQKRVRNGYWLAHRAMNSQARVHYESGYNIPSELGMFDIGILSCVLLRSVNPTRIIEQVARLTTHTMIIVDMFHDGANNLSRTIELYPTAENGQATTWWRFSGGFLTEMLKIVGFPNVRISESTQYYRGHPETLHTVVGERSAPQAC